MRLPGPLLGSELVLSAQYSIQKWDRIFRGEKRGNGTVRGFKGPPAVYDCPQFGFCQKSVIFARPATRCTGIPPFDVLKTS